MINWSLDINILFPKELFQMLDTPIMNPFGQLLNHLHIISVSRDNRIIECFNEQIILEMKSGGDCNVCPRFDAWHSFFDWSVTMRSMHYGGGESLREVKVHPRLRWRVALLSLQVSVRPLMMQVAMSRESCILMMPRV
jgi:hypothetical protein